MARSSDSESDDAAAQGLIIAAWEVLERTGFEGFKVASVIRSAGTSTKTFYRHFESKDAMLLALLLDEMHRAGRRLDARVRAARTGRESIRSWIATVLGVAAHPNLRPRAQLFSSLQAVSSGFPEEVADGRKHLIDPLTSAIQRALLEAGVPRAVGSSLETDALAVYVLTGGILRELLDGTAPFDANGAVALVDDFTVRALGLEPREQKTIPVGRGDEEDR